MVLQQIQQFFDVDEVPQIQFTYKVWTSCYEQRRLPTAQIVPQTVEIFKVLFWNVLRPRMPSMVGVCAAEESGDTSVIVLEEGGKEQILDAIKDRQWVYR